MEIRIGREKRHLEVGEKQHREEEAPVAEQVQLTKVGEGFYGLPVGPGLFCFFIFLFIPKPCSCFEVCNNHMASPCHALCSPRRRLGDLNEWLATARLAALKTMFSIVFFFC